MIKINYASLKRFDVANSPFVGTTLFVSGCNFHCKGCFNSEAQAFGYGNPFTKEIEDLFISYTKDPQVKNVNILGGEPMQQSSEIILNLVKRIKQESGKCIWMWTGYVYEELLDKPDKLEILKYIDVLVDGQFQLENRDLTLKYKGSSNQRVIDVVKSFKNNTIILWEE